MKKRLTSCTRQCLATSSTLLFFLSIFLMAAPQQLAAQCVATTPTVAAFAIQPSCNSDGTINSDGYIQISAVTDALSYEVNEGGAIDGSGTRTTLSGAAYPLQISTGLTNPTGSRDYTVRVYLEDVAGDATCFVDVVVMMNEQDCTVECDCADYLYLNDTGLNYVEKFRVNADGSLTEIGDSQNGMPWLNANGIVDSPHGIAADLNGFVYIGQLVDGDTEISKFDCAGNVVDVDPSTAAIDPLTTDGFSFNHFTVGNYLYANIQVAQSGATNTGEIRIYDLCTGVIEGCQALPAGNLGVWGLTEGPDDGYWYGTSSTGFVVRGLLDPSAFTDGIGGCGTSEVYMTPTEIGLPDPIGLVAALGITFDADGNMYLSIGEGGYGFEPPSYLLKFAPDKTLLAQSLTDANRETNISNGLNWAGARGIVYSPFSNTIYASSSEDCIAGFNTDLTYLPSSSVHIRGVYPKGIGISTECCPSNNNQVVNVEQCITATSDPIFLNNLFPCEGVLCNGEWAPADVASESIFDACNQTIMSGITPGCYSFTRSSDGTGAGAECGAFIQTLNISIGLIESGIITPENQTICRDDEPVPLVATAAVATGGTVTYQWYTSTESDSTGYSLITGATNLTYAPTNASLTSDTTYFRIESSTTTCANGLCRDTSEAVLVVILTDPIEVTVPEPSVICYKQSIDLTQGTSITPDVLGGVWSTPDGSAANFVTGTDFATATTYMPDAADISRGSVTLVLTTTAPDGVTCTPESDTVTVEILNADCGSFFWDGNGGDDGND